MKNIKELLISILAVSLIVCLLFFSTDRKHNKSNYEYKIVKKLGEGGFGRVMLGVHKKTGFKVAIKFVDPKSYGDASNVNSIFTE